MVSDVIGEAARGRRRPGWGGGGGLRGREAVTKHHIHTYTDLRGRIAAAAAGSMGEWGKEKRKKKT